MTKLPATQPSAVTRHARLAFFASLLLVAASLHWRQPPIVPVADAVGYVRLAQGLAEFGVFGYFSNSAQAPQPDSEVVPLYPLFLAGLMRLDPSLRSSLLCLLSRATAHPRACSKSFMTMAYAQGLLMAIFLLTVWLTGWLLSRRKALAWMAMYMAWFSGLPMHYADLFLTEALVLPLFGIFILLLTQIYLQPRVKRWPLYAGLILGLLALTRPSFVYLFYFLVVGMLIVVLRMSLRKRLCWGLLVFCLGFALITTPWVMRNYLQFDRIMLSGGQYGGRTLAQRVSYNKMTAAEWGVAFIYWFPDIGDRIAQSLFAPRLYARLGWGPHSFYLEGNTELAKAIQATRGSTDTAVTYLLKNEVLGQPLKHALVTLALVWRGMFIHKYWSIFGWICALWLLGRTLRRRRYGYALAWTPGLFMLGFHAAVSVNIPRYNVILIPLLAIAMAYVLLDIAERRLRALRIITSGTQCLESELYAITCKPG